METTKMSCPPCNNTSTKTRTFMCVDCMRADKLQSHRKENGDSPFLEPIPNTKFQDKSTTKKSKSVMQVNNLASGDHEITNIKTKCDRTKSVDFVFDKQHLACNHKLSKTTGCLKTIHEYKNLNYCDSESDSFALMSCPSLPKIRDKDESDKSEQDFQRPVICPVLDCGKMIAMGSALLHFYFDHSRTLRITLNIGTPEKTHLKPNSVNENTQCLAIFLLHDKKSMQTVSSGLLGGCHKDCYPLFLMSARIPSPKIPKYIKRTQNSTSILKNASTQTDYLVYNISRSCVSYSSLNENKSCNGKNVSGNENFEKDENLILWLCKLDYGTLIYSVSLMKEGNHQGHSYTGEAVHIRDKQDPATMLDRAECLIIRGVAANRLIDDDSGKIIVIVNVLDYLH